MTQSESSKLETKLISSTINFVKELNTKNRSYYFILEKLKDKKDSIQIICDNGSREKVAWIIYKRKFEIKGINKERYKDFIIKEIPEIKNRIKIY